MNVYIVGTQSDIHMGTYLEQMSEYKLKTYPHANTSHPTHPSHPSHPTHPHTPHTLTPLTPHTPHTPSHFTQVPVHFSSLPPKRQSTTSLFSRTALISPPLAPSLSPSALCIMLVLWRMTPSTRECYGWTKTHSSCTGAHRLCKPPPNTHPPTLTHSLTSTLPPHTHIFSHLSLTHPHSTLVPHPSSHQEHIEPTKLARKHATTVDGEI